MRHTKLNQKPEYILSPEGKEAGPLNSSQNSVSSGSVPGILFPFSLRLRGSAGDRIFSRRGAETQRQGRRVLLFLSCRNYPRETVSDRLRQPGIRDESCKHRKLNSPGGRREVLIDIHHAFCSLVVSHLDADARH